MWLLSSFILKIVSYSSGTYFTQLYTSRNVQKTRTSRHVSYIKFNMATFYRTGIRSKFFSNTLTKRFGPVFIRTFSYLFSVTKSIFERSGNISEKPLHDLLKYLNLNLLDKVVFKKWPRIRRLSEGGLTDKA